MKRKLNENDVPEEVSSPEVVPVAATGSKTFTDLGLDARLLQAITKEKFAEPTPVQARAIPLALEGRDILGIQSCTRFTNETNSLQPAQKLVLAKPLPMFFLSCNLSSSEGQMRTSRNLS